MAASRSVISGWAPAFWKRVSTYCAGGLALRKLGHELRASDKVFQVLLFIDLELLRETCLPNDDAVTDLALIAEEDLVARVALQISERRLVRADDQVAGLFELDREKESTGDIGPLLLTASDIGSAGVDDVGPEIFTRLIALAIQEIVIMLAHEYARVVDWIGVAFGRVVQDHERGRAGRADSAAFGVLQHQGGELVTFSVVIFIDQDRKSFLSLSRCKDQPAGDQHVIALLLRRVVFTGHLDRGAGVGRPDSQDPHIDRRTVFLN